MNTIDREIEKHYRNSTKLKEIYISSKNLSYKKSKELQEQQNDEYDKMMFLKNLRKEIVKRDENEKRIIRF